MSYANACASGRRIESVSGNSVSPVMPAARILPRSHARSTCLRKSLDVVQDVSGHISVISKPFAESWPGLSRPSTSLSLKARRKEVDARDKRGHDAELPSAGPRQALGAIFFDG